MGKRDDANPRPGRTNRSRRTATGDGIVDSGPNTGEATQEARDRAAAMRPKHAAAAEENERFTPRMAKQAAEAAAERAAQAKDRDNRGSSAQP